MFYSIPHYQGNKNWGHSWTEFMAEAVLVTLTGHWCCLFTYISEIFQQELHKFYGSVTVPVVKQLSIR